MKKRLSLVGLTSVLLALTTILAISGCRKIFDEPIFGTASIPTNSTIKQMKTLNPANGQFLEITNDVVFSGVVTANDKSGNIYKMIYVQDSTSAIGIELDATGLFNQYPVGREIFVKAKGLFLVNEAGMIKLALRTYVNGVPTVSGIPSTLIDKYIVRGSINNDVTPKQVTIAQLNNIAEYQSMLIQLNDYEVVNGDLNKTYADTSANRSTVNINLKDCGSNTIIMRSSGYANFAGVRVPQGRGSVTAIFTVFGTTKQLLIRDTTDLKLNGPRCGAANPNLVIRTIQEIRALYAGGAATIPANTGIEGIIVSNAANEAAGNYRIQDASGYGIQVRFTTAGNPGAVLGDKFIVDLSGLTVDLFNGDMQVNNVASATKTGTGTVTPRATTVSAINANLAASASNNWASTVVTLSNVTITQTSTNTTGTNYSVTDATGTIVTFVRNTLRVPLLANASSFTGYVSLFNGTPQITIRQASDVVAAAPTVPVLTTTAVTGITQTTATSGGNVTSQGASAVTARGVVWSTSPTPTIALSTKTNDGTGTGTFTSSITGLAANTTYYVRAYATNGSGTAYGNEVQFTTSSGTGGGSGIALTTSPVTLNFNGISSGLPQGVTVRTSATATSLGTEATFNTAKALWAATGSGFKNFASGTGLSSTADSATQVDAPNRALGVRQTGTTDMGVAFVFEINNTTGRSNLKLEFLLQSLDATVGRTATWTVDYGVGDNPTSFTAVAPTSGTMTTGPSFTSSPIVVNFPAALNNVSSKVWIRIVVLQATTGSGNRPSTAIDDVKFSWN